MAARFVAASLVNSPGRAGVRQLLVLLDAVLRDDPVSLNGLLVLGGRPGEEVPADLDVVVGWERSKNVSS